MVISLRSLTAGDTEGTYRIHRAERVILSPAGFRLSEEPVLSEAEGSRANPVTLCARSLGPLEKTRSFGMTPQ